MRRIHFSNNWNGKLLQDVFTTIRVYDYDKYPDGELFEIEYKNKVVGLARLEAKKPFRFGELNDITSMVECGFGRAYLSKLLKTFYGDKINSESALYMLILKWEKRNMEVMQELFNERWQKIIDAEIQESTSQLTLKM
jgi:hypothetical protein